MSRKRLTPWRKSALVRRTIPKWPAPSPANIWKPGRCWADFSMNSVTNPGSRLRIIALGYIVRWPLGGMVWSNLHFLMGLRDLGHEVYYLEDSDDYASCYDPERSLTDANPAYGLSFAAKVLGRLGFAEHWAFHDAHTSTWH